MATIVEWVACTIYAAIGLILAQNVLPLLFNMFFGGHKRRTKLFEEKWKRDTVYLYQARFEWRTFGDDNQSCQASNSQMPGTSNLPSVSPFCLKVETFLRLHQINYERRYFIVGRGVNGKLPFIELNGEHMSDSQIIFQRLVFHFKLKEYSNEEEAIYGHAVARMADKHTYNLFLHYKINHNPANLFKGLLGGLIPEILVDIFTPLVAPIVSTVIHKRLKDAFGSFSEEEYREMTRADLTTYQNLLGDKKYLFGDKMNSADCAVFGHLAAMYYLDQHSHPVYLMKSHQYVPLRTYIERVKDHLFAGKFCM